MLLRGAVLSTLLLVTGMAPALGAHPSAPAVPAPSSGGPPDARGLPTASQLRPYTPLEIVLRLPHGRPFVSALEDAQRVDLDEWGYSGPIHDLDGDGLGEVVITHHTSSVGLDRPGGTVATIAVHDGASGGLLWAKKWPDTAGVFAMGARVGPDAANGVIVFQWVQNSDGTEIELSFDALNARGRSLWSKSYLTRITYGGNVLYTVDGLLTADVFDGAAGKQTDLLLGMGRHVAVSYNYSVTDIATTILDGNGANERAHPGSYQSFNFFPIPWATGDLSNDGLDDYVLTRAGPAVVRDAEGAPVITTTGVLTARRGDSGATLWEQALDLGWFAWVSGRRDVTLGPEPDLLVAVYDFDEVSGLLPFVLFPEDREEITLVEGSSGRLMWTRPGFWHMVAGNVDRDGGPDVLTFEAVWGDRSITTKIRAYSTSGDLLYRRTYETDHAAARFGWSMWGVGPAGDVHPDRIRDVAIYHAGGAGPATAAYDTFIVDGRDGKLHMRGGRELMALGASLDRDGSDLIATCSVPPGALQMEGIAGTDGRSLWTSLLEFDVPVPERTLNVWPLAARLTRGVGEDVILNVITRQGSHVVVLDGHGGRLLWTKQMTGLVNPARPGDPEAAGYCSDD